MEYRNCIINTERDLIYFFVTLPSLLDLNISTRLPVLYEIFGHYYRTSSAVIFGQPFIQFGFQTKVPHLVKRLCYVQEYRIADLFSSSVFQSHLLFSILGQLTLVCSLIQIGDQILLFSCLNLVSTFSGEAFWTI